ncbi:MAG: hypothetical protein QOK27_2805, partial [Gemmatimonadales bacterium]|nr:hypothetical protein [Gemmatimonadales bacterium]
MKPSLTKIQTACARLEEGRFEEVLQVLGEDPGPESIVSESISLIARGLIFERDGDAAGAD